MRKLLIYILCIFLVNVPSVVSTATEGHRALVEALYNEVVAYNLKAAGSGSLGDWVGEYLPEHIGSGAEWYIFALQEHVEYSFAACAAPIAEKINATTAKVTQQKYALAMLAAGGDTQIVQNVLADTVGKQGLMSWVYGLHLMNNGVEIDTVSADSVIAYLLETQFTDGGWALMGAVSDTDVTAMTVQALAPYYGKREDVTAAIDRAIGRLSELQNDQGEYRSFGKFNPESAAQVWIALSSVGVDALADDRFIKNGHDLANVLSSYKLTDGSYAHSDRNAFNAMATVQAFMAYSAYLDMLDGNDGIYLINSNRKDDAKAPLISGYKPIGTIVVGIAAAVAVIALLLLKKRNIKNYAAVLALAGVLIALLWTVDVQKPEDYYVAAVAPKRNVIGTATLEILCDKIAGENYEHIPADGVILAKTAFEIAENETAYDVLLQAAKEYSIHLQSSGARGMIYISGIANINEYDFGDLSGWIYFVNGESHSVSCDGYTLSDGDEIVWRYTLELGNDFV